MTSIDWKSTIRSIRFQDGFYHFRDIPGDKSLSVVFDVRQVEMAGGTVRISESAWAIIPIFKMFDKKLYVRSGYFQAPLFRSPVKKEVLTDMMKYEDPYAYLRNMVKKRKI